MAELNTKTWADGSVGGTPITAAELNRMEALIVRAIGGSPVLPPASPNVRDDEFDGTSSVTWTNTTTAASVWSINGTVPNRLYLKANAGSPYQGKVQTVPGAYPYTITTRLNLTTGRANFNRAGGILLAPASAVGTSNIYYAGIVYNSGLIAQRITATYAGSFVSQVGTAAVTPRDVFLRVVVTSATVVDSSWSYDGQIWVPIETAFNPGFAPATMGLCANDESSGGGVETVFDFFRVT